MIVGFEIEVERVEAKFKLSQNRSQQDRANIITSLSQSSEPQARAVAVMMAEGD